MKPHLQAVFAPTYPTVTAAVGEDKLLAENSDNYATVMAKFD